MNQHNCSWARRPGFVALVILLCALAQPALAQDLPADGSSASKPAPEKLPAPVRRTRSTQEPAMDKRSQNRTRAIAVPPKSASAPSKPSAAAVEEAQGGDTKPKAWRKLEQQLSIDEPNTATIKSYLYGAYLPQPREMPDNMDVQHAIDVGIPVARRAAHIWPQSVRDTPRPELMVRPLNISGFDLIANLHAATTVTDNAKRNPTDIADVYFDAKGDILLSRQFGPYSVGISADIHRRTFARRSEESFTAGGAGVEGEFRPGTAVTVRLSGAYGRRVEMRGSANNVLQTESPVNYNQAMLDWNAAYKPGVFGFSASVQWVKADFQDNRDSAGVAVSLAGRDSQNLRSEARIHYEVLSDVRAVMALRFESLTYSVSTNFNRDNRGVVPMFGFDGAVTPLLRGHALAGVMVRSFTDPRLAGFSRFVFDVGLEWLPSRRDTVSISALRQVRASALLQSSVEIRDTFAIQYDHEVKRDLIVSLHGSYRRSHYPGVGERDHMTELSGQGQWLISPRYSLGVQTTFRKRGAGLFFPAGQTFRELATTVSVDVRP